MNVIMLNSENDFFPLEHPNDAVNCCKRKEKKSQLHLMHIARRKELFSISLIASYFTDLHPEQQYLHLDGGGTWRGKENGKL